MQPVQELGEGFIANQSVLLEAVLVSGGVIWVVTGLRSSGVQSDVKIRAGGRENSSSDKPWLSSIPGRLPR